MIYEKNSIIKFLLLLGTYLQGEGDRLLGEFGINQQQFIVLKEIKEKNPGSQKEICSLLLYKKSNISKIIKKLANAGLIKIDHNPKDQRIIGPVISETGNVLIKKCMEVFNKWNLDYLRLLSSQEIKVFHRILKKLENNLR
jgi:DNA-binding MarR family transcriptional regulator